MWVQPYGGTIFYVHLAELTRTRYVNRFGSLCMSLALYCSESAFTEMLQKSRYLLS